MRSTMRDECLKSRPTRASTRRKQPFGGSQVRRDSLSCGRAPMTQTPSPHDATLAAQLAQLRIYARSPVVTGSQNARLPDTSVDVLSTTYSSNHGMRSLLVKPKDSTTLTYDHTHGTPLDDLRGITSVSVSTTASFKNDASSKHRHDLPGRLKHGLSKAVESYTDVWKQRKEHVSDEQLALRAIKDYVQDRRRQRRIGSPVSRPAFKNALPCGTQHGNVAWPSGIGVPLERAPTPPQLSSPLGKEQQISSPKPTYPNSRNRNPSIHTARTGMTTWSKIINAVGHDKGASRSPVHNPFAGAFIDPHKDKGKSKGKGKTHKNVKLRIQLHDLPYSQWRLKPVTIQNLDPPNSVLNVETTLIDVSPESPDAFPCQESKRWWDRDQHKFDPNRESYISVEPAARFRPHTTASSIYSQPAAGEASSFAGYPPPPPIPGKYSEQAPKICPISPQSIDIPVSAFLSPPLFPSLGHTNRRKAGDWTDSFNGSAHLHTLEKDKSLRRIAGAQPKAQAQPRYGGGVNEQYDANPARGTQFYDFYRDSGVVFREDK